MEAQGHQNGASETPWTPLGHLGGHVGSFGGFWVALWSSLGALWELWGGLWELFGAILGAFCEYFSWILERFWISSETNYEALFSWFSDNFLMFFNTLPKMRRSLPLEKSRCICNFFVSFSRR